MGHYMDDVTFLCRVCGKENWRDGLCRKHWHERRLKQLVENGPLNSDWLIGANERSLRNAAEDGNLNLCLDYVQWHRALVESVRESEK